MGTDLFDKLVRYLIAGSIAAGLWTAILVFLVECTDMYPAFASAIGFVISSILNYLMQYFWTFKAGGAHHVMATRYTIVTISMLIVNLGIFQALFELMQLPYLAAHVIATGAVVILNFTINRFYTFV